MSQHKTRSKSNGTTIDSNPVIFEYPPDQDVNSTRGVITLTKHDLKLLTAPKFLNDNIISFFMQYHLDKSVSEEIRDKVHVFNSFFFAKIKSLRTKNSEANDYSCASRWVRGVEIFNKDFLIMPVCEKDHWILVIVCYPSKNPSGNVNNTPDNELYEPSVFVLNSSFGYAPSVKKSLSQFLRFQWHIERKELRSFPIQARRGIRLIFPDIPQQKNNWNCGVFVLNFFHCFLRDPRGTYIRMFRQESMKNWFSQNRDICLDRRIMKDILNRQIRHWSENKDKRIDEDDTDEIICSDSTSSSPCLIDDAEINSVIVIR